MIVNFSDERAKLASDPNQIIAIEKNCFDKIFEALWLLAPSIKADFDTTIELRDYWMKYAPRQRGHKPRGTSLPWGEVGEKVLDAYLYKAILSTFSPVRFVGLPYGHDVRFVTDDAFIHIDVKSTGPTDSPDEVVSSPNQVSGDGKDTDGDGVVNSIVTVVGPTQTMEFQPELPPFYLIGGRPYLTITFYLKCVYSVVNPGNQPLNYLELICVPNGLMLFDTINYAKNVPGLLTPGKDISTSKHKRTRIKLNPLAGIAPWRCASIKYQDDQVIRTRRSE